MFHICSKGSRINSSNGASAESTEDTLKNENEHKNDEDLKNYNNLKKDTFSHWIVFPNNNFTKPLITMDLSHRRLSSTDNVRYVSENNLQQILLSLVDYQ